MRTFYLQRYGVDSVVVHRWLPRRPPSAEAHAARPPGRIDIGHIGSVYSLSDFTRLADAVDRLREEDQDARLVIISPSRQLEARLNRRHAGVVELHEPMAEAEAERLLGACAMVYAAHPFSRGYRTFRRTSLPTKLSTYVMAGAPILAHAPSDSTVTHFVTATGTGEVTTATDAAGIAAAVRRLASSPAPAPAVYDAARDTFFGESGPDRLAVALSALDE
jgi:hypothetical protein